MLVQRNTPRGTGSANGGAMALGHPLGCTGAKLITRARTRAEHVAQVCSKIGGGGPPPPQYQSTVVGGHARQVGPTGPSDKTRHEIWASPERRVFFAPRKSGYFFW